MPVESPARENCMAPASADTAALQFRGRERTPASPPAVFLQNAQDPVLLAARTAKGLPHTESSRTATHLGSDNHECTQEPCGFPDAETPVCRDQIPETASAAQSCCASSAAGSTGPTAVPPH